MRNKKIFSFDEEKDAVRIIEDGFPNGIINYSQMYLVAKYFRHMFNYGAIRLERELIKFCIAQDKNFNPVVDAEAIKKWIRSAMNYDLRKIENVTISQKEIDFLKTIDIPKDRKLLFITLVFSKALKKRGAKHNKTILKTSDNYYIHYNNFLDIIRLSGLSGVSEINLASIFYKYKNHIGLYNPERELVKIDYADKNQNNGVTIDLQKISECYELFFSKEQILKKNVIYCVICEKETPRTKNNQKYCEECSKKIRKKQERERKRAKRNNS
jgi:hypothetical protein